MKNTDDNLNMLKQLNVLAEQNQLLEYLELYVKYLESNNLISNCRINLYKMLNLAIKRLNE